MRDVRACVRTENPMQHNSMKARRIPLYVDTISSTTIRVYTIPTDAPEADGTISWNSTTMVLVELAVGDMRGIGYTYADAATAKAAEHLLKTIDCRRRPAPTSGDMDAATAVGAEPWQSRHRCHGHLRHRHCAVGSTGEAASCSPHPTARRSARIHSRIRQRWLHLLR